MNEKLIKSTALKDVIQTDAVKNRLREIMGARGAQFGAALVQIVNQSSQLQKCEPNSVIGAALTAAALDLSVDPNLGEAHIIPFGDKATLQIGYKGFIQLAMRSGEYKSLGSVVVYDGELQVWDELTGELVIDRSKRKEDAQKIGYAAKFKLLNGFERGEFWTCDEVEEHASQYSKSYRYAKGDKAKEATCLWVTKRDEMSLKTVEKSLLNHYGPKSIQMRKAIKMDGGAVVDVDTDTVSYVDNPTELQVSEPDFGKGEKPKVEVQQPKPENNGSKAKAVLGLVQLAGLTEDKVVAFLHEVGVADRKYKTLEEIGTAHPDALELLHDDHQDVFNRIKQLNKGQ